MGFPLIFIFLIFQLPVPVMRDNYPDDKYLYEIIVETGPNDNHATTSTINFILSGNECDTEVRFVCLFESRVHSQSPVGSGVKS